MRLQEIGVLAKKTDTGACRNRAFQQGYRVNKTAGLQFSTGEPLDFGGKGEQAGLYNIVIIKPPGITRHPAKTLLVFKGRRFGIIINRQREYGKRLRHKGFRVRMEFGAARHVIHVGGKSGFAPLAKSLIIIRKGANRSDADDGKTQFPGRVFDVYDQLAHNCKTTQRRLKVSI